MSDSACIAYGVHYALVAFFVCSLPIPLPDQDVSMYVCTVVNSVIVQV